MNYAFGIYFSNLSFLYLAFNSHICNLILTLFSIAPLLLSFIYSFLSHLVCSIVQHFVLPSISSIILFFTLLSFLLHLFFLCWFFLACSFVYLILQGFYSLLYSFVESVAIILFSLFFYHVFVFWFFIAILYVMIHHQCCKLYSLFYGHIPVSIYIPLDTVYASSLKILFKVFLYIISISFISSFYPIY